MAYGKDYQMVIKLEMDMCDISSEIAVYVL